VWNLIKLASLLLVATALVVAIKLVFIVAAVLIALGLTFLVARWLYHAVNPAAKEKYLAKKSAEETRLQSEKAEEQAKVRAAEFDEFKRETVRRELNMAHRDSDRQDSPYTYEIGKHANEALAIRYGIANEEKTTKEYWYSAPGGVKTRNAERDTFYYEPRKTIRVQKISKLSSDIYEVMLSDFRNRRAKVVIEAGTDYIKTFYPLGDSWFDKNSHLETTLKGNGSFTLKELAEFHVLKAIIN
jgi:hypothetical protein